MTRGFLITLEGIDGCGKSSVSQEVERRWAAQYPSAPLYRSAQPSAGPIGKFLREQLKRSPELLQDKHQVETLALLMAADRNQHYWEELAPQLQGGTSVLCDRYAWSSYAYQGAFGVALRYLVAVNLVVPSPDLVIYLQVSPAVAVSRMNRERSTKELFEGYSTLKNISEWYQYLLQQTTGFKALDTTPIKVINAEQSFEQVVSEVYLAVQGRLLGNVP